MKERIIMNEKPKQKPCETCSMRAKYDTNPGSFVGRFWRWHIKFCPGWRGYMKSLDEESCGKIKEKYNLKQ